jgi:hypothetical protein
MKGNKKPGDSFEIVGLEVRRSGGGDCSALAAERPGQEGHQ